MPKFGSKNTLFRYFSPRMPYLDIFGEELKKTIVIFEISTLQIFYFQNFMKKQKCINSGPKMPDLDILELELESNIVTFEIITLKFVYLQNFA